MENGPPEVTNEQRISRKQISFVKKKIRKKPSIGGNVQKTITSIY